MIPKISINIPCFNSSGFIKQTLESALSQTYSDFEVIVMDDGSTDGTKEAVGSFSDRRIRYFYKANEGLSETRNKAIAASRGEYIAFLDHDDLWMPGKLEAQAAFLEKNRDTALVFSDAYILRNGITEKAAYFSRCRPSRGFIFEDLLLESSNFIPLSSVMIRREIFGKIGYFKKEFKIGEEYELFLRASDKYRFDYINKPLTVIRIHGGNFSARKELFVKEALEILEFWKRERPELFRQNEKRFMKKEAALFNEMASFYALNSKKREALANFDLSLGRYGNKSVFVKRCALSILGCGGYNALKALFNRVRYAS